VADRSEAVHSSKEDYPVAMKNREAKERKRQTKLVRRKQKRAREVREERREKVAAVVPYSGKRYNQEPFVNALFHAEIGIHEAAAMALGRLTDNDVRRALEYTILAMRKGQLTLDHWQVDDGAGLDGVTLIVWNIGCRWQLLFEDQPSHSRNDLIGILRRILFSVNVWTAEKLGGRGYLKFLAGQMDKLGVSLTQMTEAEAEKRFIKH
jgi:hypothetical protein